MTDPRTEPLDPDDIATDPIPEPAPAEPSVAPEPDPVAPEVKTQEEPR